MIHMGTHRWKTHPDGCGALHSAYSQPTLEKKLLAPGHFKSMRVIVLQTGGACALTSDLSRLLVHVVNLELDVAVRYVEHLVVLLEHLRVSLNTGLEPGQCDGHVVAGGSTAALGVEEEASAVRRGLEAAAHLEAGLNLVAPGGRLGDEVLHGEEERDALVVHLDGGRGVVDAVLE